MPKRQPKKRVVPESPPESQAADALTVLWLVLAMTTLACELGWLSAYWYRLSHPEAQAARALNFLLAFTALVAGGLVLLLVPAVLKVRRQKPPPTITVTAMAIGAAPFLMLVWQMA